MQKYSIFKKTFTKIIDTVNILMFKYLAITYFNIDLPLPYLESNPMEVLILQNLTLKAVQTMFPSKFLTKHSLFHM